MAGPSTQRASMLIDLNRYAEAESLLRDALQVDPQDAADLRLLALAVNGQGRHAEALPIARSAVAVDPQHSSGFIVLADIARACQLHAESMGAATTAITLDPHSWATHYTRANTLRSGDKADRRRALVDADEAVRLAPHSSQAHNLRGLCLGGLRRRGEERAAYEEALRLDPTNAWAMNNLAAVDLSRGRVRRAGQHLTAGLSNAPQHQTLQRNFDVLLLRLLQRFWWVLLALAVVEGILLAQDAPAWSRAAVGGVGLVTGWLVWRRATRGLPASTNRIARGLWGRLPGASRFLLGYWLVTGLCVMALAFAPRAAALAMGAVLIVALRFVGFGLLIVWIGRRVSRR